MELAFYWAQKIKQQSNTQGTLNCQGECKGEKLDPGMVLEGGGDGDLSWDDGEGPLRSGHLTRA